jgi:PAS domain S-box-containing protein
MEYPGDGPSRDAPTGCSPTSRSGDVTDRYRAQAALQEGNRLLGRLREANVLGVLVASEGGSIHEANDAFLGIVGYTRQDFEAGRITWDAITPPEWAHADDEAVEQMGRTGAFRPYEKEYLHRDGHRVPVLIGAALLDRNPLRWADVRGGPHCPAAR